MNKEEKVIVILLALALGGWIWNSHRQAAQQARQAPPQPLAAAQTAEMAPRTPEAALPAVTAPETAPPYAPETAEEEILLDNGEMILAISSHGAGIKRATLTRYTSKPGAPGADNPPVTLDFSAAPALELAGLAGLPRNAAYQVARDPSGTAATLMATGGGHLALERRIELLPAYKVRVTDRIRNQDAQPLLLGTNSVAVGTLARGESRNEILSMDTLAASHGANVRHWDRDRSSRALIGGDRGLGCGGAPSAIGLPETAVLPVNEPQNWVAIKSRFFVTGFFPDAANAGLVADLTRDAAHPTYTLKRISARVLFAGQTLAPGEEVTRGYTMYIGPKRLALLQALDNGFEGVMQFGFFAWFCELLVPTLNFFYRIIPNYGVAIILLTFLVRVIFWPLTHKSTQSMKKMQEVQPKLKEIQALHKDNPKKLQQETWAVYRENKVNPMSSCLPMLVQIPVFIALFTVLRSAVELRFASFLWIADLSEPENLLAGALPIPLNILPFLMSGTMALQSYLTPTVGDPMQQRMMMIMMPVMMLFMFYSFPAALSLYWTVSQALSIAQMLLMRRRVAHRRQGGPPDAAESASLTRQQRRQVLRGG